MGIPGSANLLMLGGGAQAYQIEQSLRFDGAAELYWTPSSAGNRDTWTWSAWIKLSKPHDGTNQCIFSAYTSGNNDSTQLSINFPGTYNSVADTLTCGLYSQTAKTTNARYRDYSAWYHVVVVREKGASTTTDGMRFYINNERVDIDAYDHLLSATTAVNNNITHRIGEFNNYNRHFHGYMAEVHFLDGTAVTDAEDFGEFDDNGVWRPIEYTGSHGTNGFYLTFDPTATNGIGHDHSGNGNNWTASGFTTSGTGTDVMDDTPTNNWCTMNPLDNRYSSNTLSDGNLKVATPVGANYAPAKSTFGVSSGKWYWECNADAQTSVGILQGEAADNYLSGQSIAAGYVSDGRIFKNSSVQTNVATFTATDTLGFALDLDNLTIAFYKNNTLVATVTALTAGTYFVAGGDQSSTAAYVLTFNFGQRAFAYTPPTGFKALNTANLPAPDIADGSDHFKTLLYTGDGTAPRSLTGVGFQPDWVWIKRRDAATWHVLGDSVRGSNGVNGLNLNTNSTAYEGDENSGHVESWDSDGFTVEEADSGSYPLVNVNNNTSTYVAWNWKAGGTASSNTAGSITSTVSANPSAGFSIVSYTGNGTNNATVGHGLGVTPSCVIVKSRDALQEWIVYHSSLTTNKNLILDLDLAESSWNEGYITLPTSTTFRLTGGPNLDNINTNGDDHIAYCFAEVEGYSKFGSYTGNGSSDGTFVHLGFKPSWLLVKRYNTTGAWFLMDAERNTYNVVDNFLYPNSSEAENSGSYSEAIDFLSNGFKCRTTSGFLNGSGDSYIFAAFAENPFGGDGVSPATAR